MRLVIAIIPDRSAGTVTQILTEARFTCTQIASSGRFLEQGHATLIIGVPQRQVEQVLRLLRSTTPGEGVAFVLSARGGEHGVVRAFQ